MHNLKYNDDLQILIFKKNVQLLIRVGFNYQSFIVSDYNVIASIVVPVQWQCSNQSSVVVQAL